LAARRISYPRRPLFPFLVPNAQPRRTLFGGLFDRSKARKAEEAANPFLKDATKPKSQRPDHTSMQGSLASSSIFESEEDAALEKSPQQQGIIKRNTALMRMKLDPDPRNRERFMRKMVIRSLRTRGRLSKTLVLKRTERESVSKSELIKTSTKKLGPLARQITGKTLDEAIVQMRFSGKRAGKDVLEHLKYARDVAIVRNGMGLSDGAETKTPIEVMLKNGKRRIVKDPRTMYVSQAWVGKGKPQKGLDHRARGQVHILNRPWTCMYVPLTSHCVFAYVAF
jgi:ribosomal protein L22